MSRKTSKFRKMFRNKSRNKSRVNRMRPLAGLLAAAGLSLPLLAGAQSAPSVPYPTYVTGPQRNGSWVVSNGLFVLTESNKDGSAPDIDTGKIIRLNDHEFVLQEPGQTNVMSFHKQ